MDGLPRILVIDDLFGRNTINGVNKERENLCAHFLWRDLTGDVAARSSKQKIVKPAAEAIFFRGQTPSVANVDTVVENDLAGTLAVVRSGWVEAFAKGEVPWALILLDLCFYTGKVTEESNRRMQGMPEGHSGDDDFRTYFGLTLLDAIHKEFPDLPVMILSSKPREEVSLEFTRRGAVGFIDRADLRGPEILQDALWHHGLLPDSSGRIVGNSLPVLLALREARRSARHRENILIRGERGTGKELFSQYINSVANDRENAKRTFVTVNSAVLSSSMFASELFGISPRTATDVDGKIGLIEAADGGDLFLDEIADMPQEVQAAVLRVLQDRQITPVGARKPKDINIRFISATNVDLENSDSGFRSDLLDRLRFGGTIILPPLRDRKTDIPILAEVFVRIAEKNHKGALKREITKDAIEKLMSYDWLGNVRELQTCLFNAVNGNPDVEHLVPRHLVITSQLDKNKIQAHATNIKAEEIQTRDYIAPATDLDKILKMQVDVHFGMDNIMQWAGCLGDIEYANLRLLANCLKAALIATKDRTSNPAGIIQIHPALKLMTGDSSLTAVEAYDIIKRILGPLDNDLKDDLRDAYKQATLQRGKPRKRRLLPRKREV
ncbi:MAG: sigma-54-dependent Fis family transcriptional regulator [Desulfobacteraceae bacterium]|nr:MAG: sigma-54-dependent Fis family transcriptional regulator [Desulfobacteraceae bacterium]